MILFGVFWFSFFFSRKRLNRRAGEIWGNNPLLHGSYSDASCFTTNQWGLKNPCHFCKTSCIDFIQPASLVWTGGMSMTNTLTELCLALCQAVMLLGVHLALALADRLSLSLQQI